MRSKAIRFPQIILALVFISLFGFRARADTIAADTAGSSGIDLSEYLGQSVLTGSGGPWTNITFAFLGSGGTDLAAGDLFIFTQQYTGTVAGLSSGAGLVAESTGISGGAWTLASTLTLAANTEYYFYSDHEFGPDTVVGSLSSSDYSGGMVYGALPPSYPDFTAVSTSDANFRLTGTVKTVAAPEPASGLLLVVGLFALVGPTVWKKRNS